MKFLKENWEKMLLLIGAAFLFWLIIRGCKSNDNSAFYRREDSLISVIKSNNDRYDYVVDSLNEQRKSDSVVKAKMYSQLSIAKVKVEKYQDKARYYAELGDSLKAALDTIGLLASCDSLRIEVRGLVFSNEALYKEYNQVIARLQIESDSNDSVSVVKDKLYHELRMTTDELIKDNNSLRLKYKKTDNGRKFNKTTVRFLSAAVLILGGIVMAK